MKTPRTSEPRSRRHTARGLAVALGVAGLAGAPPAAADAPPGRYTATSTTVHDNATGLEWLLVPSTTTLTRADAITHCQNQGAPTDGWRLPAVHELLSIVDPTRVAPAVDAGAFASTVAGTWYWSATLYAGGGGTGWVVHLGTGETAFGGDTTRAYNLLCVR